MGYTDSFRFLLYFCPDPKNDQMISQFGKSYICLLLSWICPDFSQKIRHKVVFLSVSLLIDRISASCRKCRHFVRAATTNAAKLPSYRSPRTFLISFSFFLLSNARPYAIIILRGYGTDPGETQFRNGSRRIRVSLLLLFVEKYMTRYNKIFGI